MVISAITGNSLVAVGRDSSPELLQECKFTREFAFNGKETSHHCPGVRRAGFGAVKIAITIRSIRAKRKVVSITIPLPVVNTDFDFFTTAHGSELRICIQYGVEKQCSGFHAEAGADRERRDESHARDHVKDCAPLSLHKSRSYWLFIHKGI